MALICPKCAVLVVLLCFLSDGCWGGILQHKISSPGRAALLKLRGGAGNKRPRDEADGNSTEWQKAGTKCSGLEERNDGGPPAAKVARRSWLGLKSGNSVWGSGLLEMAASAVRGAMSMFSLGKISGRGSAGAKGKSLTKVVFTGDQDRPSAIKRQIEYYFSDHNLPTGKMCVGAG